MNSFYLYIQSRSVDKQHAVISVNLENAEYKLHDLGTLNGVSMSIPWNAIEDPIKLEVLESCVLSDSLPCAILLLKPQIGINLQDAQGTQTASVCTSSSPKHYHNNTMFSPPTPPISKFCQGTKKVGLRLACHSRKLLLVQRICTSPIVFNVAPPKF